MGEARILLLDAWHSDDGADMALAWRGKQDGKRTSIRMRKCRRMGDEGGA